MKEIIELIIKERVKENFKKLGIERTLEIIEDLPNPIFRAKLRQYHLEYLKENLRKEEKWQEKN